VPARKQLSKRGPLFVAREVSRLGGEAVFGGEGASFLRQKRKEERNLTQVRLGKSHYNPCRPREKEEGGGFSFTTNAGKAHWGALRRGRKGALLWPPGKRKREKTHAETRRKAKGTTLVLTPEKKGVV